MCRNKDGKTLYLAGNGVVIHLPGLFEEAEKNLQKGEGNVASIHMHPCIDMHVCAHVQCIVKYLHANLAMILDLLGILFVGKRWG